MKAIRSGSKFSERSMKNQHQISKSTTQALVRVDVNKGRIHSVKISLGEVNI